MCDNQVMAAVTHLSGKPIMVTCGTWFGGDKILCETCTKEFKQKYPQGWAHYPGDVCKHGRYVGGSGVDYMCIDCENGD